MSLFVTVSTLALGVMRRTARARPVFMGVRARSLKSPVVEHAELETVRVLP